VYIFITICIVIFLFRSNARISIPNNKGASVFLVQHFFGPICPPTKESQTRTDLPVAFTCAQSGRMIAPYIYTRSICFRVSSSSSHSLQPQLLFASRHEPRASLRAAPYLGARGVAVAGCLQATIWFGTQDILRASVRCKAASPQPRRNPLLPRPINSPLPMFGLLRPGHLQQGSNSCFRCARFSR
jgi:hypothetical protein